MPPLQKTQQPQATRQILATSSTEKAPFRIILQTLPLWAASLLLMFFMPLTGFISFFIIAICLFFLPFTAKRGACPQCHHFKTLPFSGTGSRCKHCNADLVLRGNMIHHIEASRPRHGSGRG